jgi:hypothetical protein
MLISFSAMILIYLYVPKDWPIAAVHLTEAMDGDGTKIYNLLLPPYDGSPPISVNNDMSRLAVTCLDSPPPKDESEFPTAEDLADIDLKTLQTVSKHFGVGAIISEPDGGCQFWPVRGPERFEGPWNHTLKHPMLIVSNTVSSSRLGSSFRLITLSYWFVTV